MNAKVVNHWGKWVNSDEPVTGVLSLNEINLDTFLLGDEICVTCESIMKEIESMDDCPECESRLTDDNTECPECRWTKDSELEFIECDSSHTKIHGDWILDTKTGQYESDKNGEFAAIENESTVQVVFSKYTKRGNLCSPCYPGQVEFSNEGEFLAYTLPDDMLYQE